MSDELSDVFVSIITSGHLSPTAIASAVMGGGGISIKETSDRQNTDVAPNTRISVIAAVLFQTFFITIKTGRNLTNFC
jgi:hypothetical protein